MTDFKSTSLERRPVPAGGTARGTVRVPSSKSVSHRQLNLALVAWSALRLSRPLDSDDLRLCADALRVLGFSVDWREDLLEMTPTTPRPTVGMIECGNAGTMMRLIAGSLTTVPGIWTLDGSARMRERPIGPLVDALKGLGAKIEYVGKPGYPPLRIEGGSLEGGATEVDAGQSSQYLSGVLLAALGAKNPSEIRVKALTSSPYVEITRRLVELWGGKLEVEGDLWRVRPGLTPLSEATVEGDYSAAPYPAAAAILTNGEVRLQGLDPKSAQGDRLFFDLLREMGANVEWCGDELLISGGNPLKAVEVDMSSMPDQVPTLAALAPFAEGTTRILNVGHLRIKECDRLAAMASELGRVGAKVTELPEGLVIEGGWASEEPPDNPVVVETYDDHRIAMSLALVGLRRPGVVIEEPGVVSKSYPEFWNDLERLIDGGEESCNQVQDRSPNSQGRPTPN